MKYITQLENKVAELNAIKKVYEEGLDNLKSYLISPKFYEDSTVQTSDILNWIADIHEGALDAEFFKHVFDRTEVDL